MIDLIDVTQHYSVRPVLKRINLNVQRGELVVVVGPNGMGKSTLLGVMAGTLAPQRGLVRIDGRFRKANEEDELAMVWDTIPVIWDTILGQVRHNTWPEITQP